jgi:hypothetical protein
MQNNTQTNYTPIIISLIVGVVIGFLIGTMAAGSTDNAALNTAQDRVPVSNDQNTTNTQPSGSNSDPVDSTLVEGDANETAFAIQVGTLSAGQQTMLKAAGVDGDSINITKGMVACAEAEIGASRVVEIQNGAQMSMAESVTLIGC